VEARGETREEEGGSAGYSFTPKVACAQRLESHSAHTRCLLILPVSLRVNTYIFLNQEKIG
jgi:hypothetical protein